MNKLDHNGGPIPVDKVSPRTHTDETTLIWPNSTVFQSPYLQLQWRVEAERVQHDPLPCRPQQYPGIQGRTHYSKLNPQGKL